MNLKPNCLLSSILKEWWKWTECLLSITVKRYGKISQSTNVWIEFNLNLNLLCFSSSIGWIFEKNIDSDQYSSQWHSQIMFYVLFLQHKWISVAQNGNSNLFPLSTDWWSSLHTLLHKLMTVNKHISFWRWCRCATLWNSNSRTLGKHLP